MAWQMPVHRDPTSLEIIIDDCIRQTQNAVDHLINSNEMLAYYWNHTYRRSSGWIIFTFCIIILWLAYSKIATWRTLKAQAAQIASLQDRINNTAHATSSRQTFDTVESPPKSSEQRKLTPVFDRIVHFGSSKNINDRTGRVSTPGYQTPYVNNSDRRNFSRLAKTAPVSYNTLLRNGVLDEEGTPTKKFSPNGNTGRSTAPDGEAYVRIYDTATKSWASIRSSSLRAKEIQSPERSGQDVFAE